MMQAEAIVYSNGKGLVADHTNDGSLDFESFKSEWTEAQILNKLQNIAKNTLSINDLQQHTEIKNALLEAYKLGEDTK
jgi:hypothetical protein